MAKIHRTAVVEGDVRLADDVEVGPLCVLLGTCGPVQVGPGCVLVSSARLNGPLTMGESNTVYPGASLGFAPQDVNFDANSAGAGLVIGSKNVFREGFTAHRGKTADPTRIGDRNFFMTNSHVGHDAIVDNDCVIVTGALVGGHAHVADKVIIGGNSAVHQFCRIGRGCMFSGCVATSLDLPMWFMLTGTNLAGSLNMIGMRRNGLTPAEIQSVRWVYKTLYRGGNAPQQALPELEERKDDPVVAEYIQFIRSSKRGICHGTGRKTRGSAASSEREAPVGNS